MRKSGILIYPLFLNCISMIRVAAWRLQVIRVAAWRFQVVLQRKPQKDQLNLTRPVVIGLLWKVVLPETARALKTCQQTANKSIGQHLPVDYVKQSRCVWCKKNTKEFSECKLRLQANALWLIVQRFRNDAITSSQ